MGKWRQDKATTLGAGPETIGAMGGTEADQRVHQRGVLKQHLNGLKGTLGKLTNSSWRLFCKKWTHLNKKPLVKSLVDCQKLTEHGFKTAEDLAQLGEIAILGYVGDHKEKLWSFTKKPHALSWTAYQKCLYLLTSLFICSAG